MFICGISRNQWGYNILSLKEEEDDKDKGVLSWFASNVLNALATEGGIETKIEYKWGYDDNKDKSPIQL